MKNSAKDFGQLFGIYFIYSFVSVFAKMASQQETLIGMAVFMGLEFCILAVYAILWQQILKKFPLTIAIACKGITVIYSIGWSAFLFRENITVWNIVGATLVVIGIGAISSYE